MTVRVTTLKGAEAGRYYTERLPSYYLDDDEPPGRWWGQAADRLGLAGVVDPDGFLALMAGRHPATGAELGRKFGEKSVRGYDATFSAPKSVSVLFGLGDDDTRREVIEAHERAVEAVLAWIQSRAHTRLRQHGHVLTVDAGGIVVAQFRQHTSRRLDPQLHTHAVIANRVPAPDGRWLALDARTIIRDQRTLSALYHACLRSELTRRLGVEWRTPEHGIAEITGIHEKVLAEFSQRTNDLQKRLEEKMDRFHTNLRRAPTVKERWRLEREAVLDSRPSKPHGPTLTELHREWRNRAQQLGLNPERLTRAVTGRHVGIGELNDRRTRQIVEQAVQALVEHQSTWRPAELVRELAAATPTTTTEEAEGLTGQLQHLSDREATARCVDISRPIPTGVPLRRDGRPLEESAIDRTLTTQEILDEETQLIEWAEKRREPQVAIKPRVTTDLDLTPGQIRAVAAVVGRRGLELIVGPAGAGKTTTLATAVESLRTQQRPIFGVAPTAAAAQVLASETGMAADTLDKLLIEHSHPHRPPEPAYHVAEGATVIVDEAGTAPTPKLAQLARLSDEHNWRIILVGDPRQFSAVGRGGMFSHLIDLQGAVELDEVHRFHNQWERAASLRLRSGDRAVLAHYDRQGRIHGGSRSEIEAQIITTWRQARSRGESVALMANSTEATHRLSQLAQLARIETGELKPTGRRHWTREQWLLEGDEIVTRRNARRLRTDQGFMVKNRDHWTIKRLHRDQSITITGPTGTVQLPARYAFEHLELGYAQTSHATQGRTVDTALLLVDTPTDRRGIYTPMTRGRTANHVYVITEDNEIPRDLLTQAITRDWIDRPAIARQAQLARDHQVSLIADDYQDNRHRLERSMRRLTSTRQPRVRDLGVEHATRRGPDLGITW